MKPIISIRIRGINKEDINNNLQSLDTPRSTIDIKKTIIENSKPTIPIKDILGFKNINTIRKNKFSRSAKI